MPNYYYFDANGQRYGLVNDQQLQALVAQGVVTPNTPLETEGGHQGLAGQIPGLKFNTPVSHSTAHTAQTAPYSQGTSSYSKTDGSGGGSFFPWLFNIVIQDISRNEANRLLRRIYWFVILVLITFPIPMFILWEIALGGEVVDLLMAFFAGCIASVVNLLINPLMWLVIIGIRLLFDYLAFITDWMIETKRAAKLYINNSVQN